MSSATENAANAKTLKIYFTSDVHGYFYPTSYGDTLEKPLGLFGCAGNFKKDENTLVIDGGDILQGSAFAYYCKQFLHSAKPIADIMNDCGYDYYTIGNHDFNYGQEYQKEYRSQSKAVCLCENITDEQGNTIYPWVIREMPNGLKVGLLGITTEFINVWEKKENLEGIRITDPFEAAKAAFAEMKKQADITVCIYHGGFECDLKTGAVLSKTKENVAYRICQELNFDVLLTGHQHMSVDGQYVNGTYTLQPLEYGKEYHYLEITKTDKELLITSEKRKADPKYGAELKEKYQSVENQVQEWLNRPAGHLSRALMPDEKIKMALYGSPIADFINRIQLDASGAQISVVGLANEIAGFRSEVSTRDIIATYPYPNTLVVCKITGAQLKAAMERSAEYFEVQEDGSVAVSKRFLVPKTEHYNYDYFAGVSYHMNPNKPLGSRVENLCFNGKEVKAEDEFSLCLNNYRFSGAGGYPMYPECPVIREINVEMVELIMDYFANHKETIEV